MRSLTVDGRSTGLSVEPTHRSNDEGVILSADIRDAKGRFVDDVTVTCNSIDTNGRSDSLPIWHSGPGEFEVRLPQLEYGRSHQLVWTVARPGEESNPTPQGLVESYSPEFAAMGVDDATLDAIAAQRQGDVMSVGQCRLLPMTSESNERVALWPFFLAAALLTAPFDILCRRLGS